MKLEKVDIFGFKSFAERTELSFHGGVTAIVGPNGCGKSNISDAIGWALGEQSAKTLRGKRMEDFIFTGSDARPPVGLAEVNLRLSQVNGDPGGATRKVLVTRRLYRSGESEYLMDGSPCRLKDIHDIFMDTGVGTKAYSIIEQGKIGLILSGRPADRRAIIEEAAGITKYKARRRSAELKLQAAQQNLLRVNDIVYEVERQMSSLRRQAGKARRYRRLRDAISHLERIAAVKRSRELEALLQGLRKRVEALSDEDLRRSTSLSVAETYLERLRLEQTEREAEAAEAREKLYQMELAIERFESQIASHRQQMSGLDARCEQLEADLRELERRHNPSLEQLELRQKDEAAVAEELSRSEQEASAAQEELTGASVSLAEAERELEDGRGELVHRISKIAALKNFLQGVVTHTEKVNSELLKLLEEVRELEAERARFELQKTELDAELARGRERARHLRAECERVDEEIGRRHRELERIEPEVERRREEVSELTGRLDSLEELVAARAHYRAGARHLLTSADSHGIRIVGTVADSLEVDSGFERAAERFLGGWLERILVASEEEARAAKSLLEKDKAGRCELLVESLAVSAPSRGSTEILHGSSLEGQPGVIGPLSHRLHWTTGSSDLLRRFLPDAIVVESLDDALRAFRAEPRASYVTLSGEVLEPPGVLRAGPGGPGEGLLSTRGEIRRLRAGLSEATRQLQELGTRRLEAQEALDASTGRLAQLGEEHHGVEKEIVALEHQGRQVEEELARVERKERVLVSERERSESERASLSAKRLEMEQSLLGEEEAKTKVEGRLEELRSALGERRALVERLQARAADEASQVAALRERAQAVRLDVERLREGVGELESRMEAARREKIEIENKKLQLDKEVGETEARLQQTVAERERYRKGCAAADEQVAVLRERTEHTEAALKARRRELEAVRQARSSEEVALAREETEMSHLRASFTRAHGISIEEAAPLLSPAEIARDEEQLDQEREELTRKLDSLGPVNPMADEEYRELETRHEFLTTQRQDLLDSISSTETAIHRIDTTSRKRFQEAFEEINRRFDETFRQLFGGGKGGLSMIDEEDVLESGIDINAQPPGKRLQNVLLLSGGEKALTAIALMFAIFRYKPSPFCLLDEVDAPLDQANVARFIAMLSELRKTTQFIIITHNRKTMEIADQMYGVTMEEPGISKLVSVHLADGNSTVSPS